MQTTYYSGMSISNQLKMKKYVIGYLDILGTTKTIKNNPEKALDGLWILNHGIRKEHNIDKNRIVRAFTDNYMIAYEVENSDYPSKISDVFQSIGYAIDIELLQNYSLVRGAVTIGDMYIDDEMIAGDGIVRAHEIENNRCKYPRVIIDSNIKNYLDINENNCSLKRSIFLDMDGEYCLNYLLYINQELLKIRKKDLVSSLNEKYVIYNTNDEDNVAQKYTWIINYIKKYCEENNI